jgi:hypothetical protein
MEARSSAWWIASLAYVLVTLVFVEPYINYRHLLDASYEGDSRLLIWTLAWDSHAILERLPLFDANIFYPARPALAWTEHHLGIALFALPVYALTASPVLAYWTVWLLAFPLNALAMYALARRLTHSHVAAFMGGLVYAFCFFRMHHAHGHVQLLWTWPLPLIPLALERWLQAPTSGWALIVAGLVVIQALASWYLAVMAALLVLVTVLVLFRGQPMTKRHAAVGIQVLLLTAGVLLWLAWPYFSLRTPGVAEAAAHAADATAYLMPPENTWLGQWLLANTSLEPRWIWGEQTLYIGITTLALSGIGLKRALATGDWLALALLLTGLLALALSFGPSASGVTPFDLFARLPGMSLLRAPARFALLVMLALAALVAFGAAALHERLGRRGPVAIALLAALMLAEAYVVKFPGGKPQPFPVPRVYRQLAQLPPGAVLSLPTYRGTPEAFRESDYLLYSTAHWKPIVNGYGRAEPPAHGDNLAVLARFPAQEAARRMRELAVRYVIVHGARARDAAERAGEARSSGDFELLAQFEKDYLYRVK